MTKVFILILISALGFFTFQNNYQTVNEPRSAKTLEGKWGSEHSVLLESVNNGATLIFDNGYVSLATIKVDDFGRFKADGQFQFQSENVRFDFQRATLPIHLKGQVNGDNVTLTYQISDRDEQTVELKLGQESTLFAATNR